MLKASSKHSHPQTSNVSRAPAAAAATATTSGAVATSAVAATTQLTALVRKTGLTNPCWQIDSKSTQRAHRGQNATSMHKNVEVNAGTTAQIPCKQLHCTTRDLERYLAWLIIDMISFWFTNKLVLFKPNLA